MVTRCPVIGSRMVIVSPRMFRQTDNAALATWIRFDCDCGYERVTAPGHSHSQSRRGVREHLACSLEEADPPRRISKAMVTAVWLTIREKKPRPAEHRTGFWVV